MRRKAAEVLIVLAVIAAIVALWPGLEAPTTTTIESGALGMTLSQIEAVRGTPDQRGASSLTYFQDKTSESFTTHYFAGPGKVNYIVGHSAERGERSVHVGDSVSRVQELFGTPVAVWPTAKQPRSFRYEDGLSVLFNREGLVERLELRAPTAYR